MKSRLRIAVVDDDPSVRKALCRLLRTAHMDAGAFASAEEFLAALAPPLPDCLVLDVRMPGMSGPELRNRLLTLGHRIPTVFITAHADELVLDARVPGETLDVLHKPFDDKALLDAIARNTGRR